MRTPSIRDYTPQARKTRLEKARVAAGEERDRLWAMQERAGDRVIPVVAVEPR